MWCQGLSVYTQTPTTRALREASCRRRMPTPCVITYANEAYPSALKYHIAVDRDQRLIAFHAIQPEAMLRLMLSHSSSWLQAS